MPRHVADVVIRRLPRYHRYLTELLDKGITRISSGDLSLLMGVTASQIRQDLNYFGGFGQQGYGYNVEHLQIEIARILGVVDGRNMIIIGAGNLGRAIAGYAKFEKRGFSLLALFDNRPEALGIYDEQKDVQIYPIDELEGFCKNNKVDIAVLTLPRSAATAMYNRIINCGIKGIWNFSHYELPQTPGIAIENVHMSDSLMTLSCKLNRIEDQD